MTETPVKSYARSNRELVSAFERYLIAKGNSAPTIRAYLGAAKRLVEHFGSTSVVECDRAMIRQFLMEWTERGLSASSITLHTIALRSFFKFVRLTGLTKHDPMLLMGRRKLPTRLPRVLSVEAVERLIAAGTNPFERAVPEVLYSTGCRVSELVKLRIEDINWQSRSIRVHKGKGGKDRVVMFGSKAAEAMHAYLAWRPSRAGYLFEPIPRTGSIVRKYKSTWNARFYVDRIQREIKVGEVRNLPSIEDAEREFLRLASKIPGYQVRPGRPYSVISIQLLLKNLAHRAGLEHVHPHALRRAMASHMLQGGANLRVVQDLLGHERLNTTMRYTWLSIDHLRKVHENCHPQGDNADAAKE